MSSRPIAGAFPRLAAILAGDGPEEPGPGPETRADTVAERFGLDTFSRDVLLLAAWSELEPEAGRAIAKRQNENAHAPTVALALATLPGAHWSAFTAESPLRAHRLLVLTPAERSTERTLSLPEPVLHYFLGAPSVSEAFASVSRKVSVSSAETPARDRFRAELASALASSSTAAVQCCGPDATGKESAVAAAAAELGRPLYVMNGNVLAQQSADLVGFARIVERDLTLVDGMLMLDIDGDVESRHVTTFAEAMPATLLINSSDAVALGRRQSVRFDMARPRAAEQGQLWQSVLGDVAEKLNGSLSRLSSHFPLAPEVMESIAADLDAAPDDADLDALAWNACRRRARPRMDDLAQRIDGRAVWNDIVLPETEMLALKAIAAQVRHRSMVYENWGFGDAPGGRGLGVSALFSGPSGAGKTLAAEVLGTALDLDVYRIDLSSVVSKWIGETEKNLRRVFDAAEEGCSILLFDEADALFGKRSEVKDSHDRYANIEVSYLLQRLEAYRGLAILTTNLRSNIDEAFLRRLRFVIDFPFPSPIERREIWARAFPENCPTDSLQAERLAQLNVVGGSIRNIAMNAAFIAADAAEPVSMRHVLAAARLEYDKAGRTMTDVELRGWP